MSPLSCFEEVEFEQEARSDTLTNEAGKRDEDDIMLLGDTTVGQLGGQQLCDSFGVIVRRDKKGGLFSRLQLRGEDLNLRPLGYEPNELPLLHPATIRP